MTYDELASELTALAEAGEWGLVRTWFSYWDTNETHIIHKDGKDYDTKVPVEKVYKAVLWSRFFMPEYFRDDTPLFHYDFFATNLSPFNEADAGPRGFSKTTIEQGSIGFQIANHLEEFIVVIEKTFTEAGEVLDGVREVFDDPLVCQVYGELVKKDVNGVWRDKNPDAEGDMFINGVRLRAKGFNTPIRGLKSKAWRPTIIYMDDVEEDVHVENEDQRRKYRENYTKGIVPAVDIEGKIKIKGTILHQDSLLKNLIDQHQGRIYEAFPFDKIPEFNKHELTDADLLWPKRWTQARLHQKKDEMELEGKGTNKFWQEFLNRLTDEKSRVFKWVALQQTFTEDQIKDRAFSRTITIDVADSKKKGADFTAVTVVDWDSENNWYIKYAKRFTLNSPELVDKIIELWGYWKPNKIGVEKNAYEDQVKPWLKIVSEEKGVFPVVVELADGGRNKQDRIKGALEGRFQANKIWFKKDYTDDTKELRGELYDFPSAKHDDLSDALAYVEQIGYRPMGLKKDVPTTIESLFWANKRSQPNSSVQKAIQNL